jgi:hypothetical protein
MPSFDFAFDVPLQSCDIGTILLEWWEVMACQMFVGTVLFTEYARLLDSVLFRRIDT